MAVQEHAVVIAGGGPTGLMLAAELALSGVDVAIVERRESVDLAGSRSRGLHARTIEVLDQRGVADRFVSQGQTYPVVHFHIPLDISDFPTRHNYVLGLLQPHTERILGEWVNELAVTIYRGRAVTGFVQDDSGVDVTITDSESAVQSFRAQYLVGCDGGRSTVRKLAGIEFPGWEATTSWLIAEVETTEEPKWGFFEDAAGRHAIGKGENDGVGVVIKEVFLRSDVEPTLNDVSNAMIGVYGTDFGVHSPRWISRFTDMSRQAASYREGRVLLAGDAAHVHPPMGGQGLNIGAQDAVNLGWKLAQVIKGTSPDTLLDSYHTERHPVGARVLRNTMAQVALGRTDERSKALGDIVSELLRTSEGRRQFAGEMSGLGLKYELGGEHPLVGRRMPDLDIVSAAGSLRVFSLLRDARPVLLNFSEARIDEGHSGHSGLDVMRWQDRVQMIDAAYDGVWEIPVIGAVAAPSAVLIRPDGYVAWVGDVADATLIEALTKWFGSPAA